MNSIRVLRDLPVSSRTGTQRAHAHTHIETQAKSTLSRIFNADLSVSLLESVWES